MNTTIRAISKISLLLPLSFCAVHVLTIGLVPGAIGSFPENLPLSLDRPEASAEQKDTFVPQPNHLPLFTRGSGTR